MGEGFGVCGIGEVECEFEIVGQVIGVGGGGYVFRIVGGFGVLEGLMVMCFLC